MDSSRHRSHWNPPRAIAFLVEHLRTKPTVYLLRDLAELRERGKGAGSAVVALLKNEDPQLGFAAARTPGYIQFTGATDALIGMLYRIVPRDGAYVAEPRRVLPRAPRRSGLLSDGRLFVSCLGADVVITPEGDMRLATPQNISGTQEQAAPASPRRK